MKTRALTPADLASYRQPRLESILLDSPSSFVPTPTHEEERMALYLDAA